MKLMKKKKNEKLKILRVLFNISYVMIIHDIII